MRLDEAEQARHDNHLEVVPGNLHASHYPPVMPRSRVTLAVILVAVITAVLVPLAFSRGRPGELVSAQIPPGPIPTPTATSPCSGCGPTPGPPGGVRDFAWSYPLHFCPPDDPTSSAVYAVVYGNGPQSTSTVTFFGEIQGHVRQLATLAPGGRAIENPAIAVGQGVTATLVMWATTDGTEGGPRVKFGNGQDQRVDLLTCDCPIVQQVATTVGSTGTTITVTNSSTPNVTNSKTSNTVSGQLPASR